MGAPGHRAGDPDGSRAKLVSLLPVRNGEEDLPRHLSSIAAFTDGVIALDDGSTDGTRQILESDPIVKAVLTNPRRETSRGWDDAGNRNRLLDAAARLDPQWVLFLDADEVICPDDGAELRRFLNVDAIPGLAYGLLHHRMWGDTDYDPVTQWIYRLFAWRPGMRVSHRRLHFNPVPDTIPRGRWIRTTIRVQHFGASSGGRLAGRQRKYREADPDDEYGSGQSTLNRPPERVVPWSPRPAGLPVLWAGEPGSLLAPSPDNDEVGPR